MHGCAHVGFIMSDLVTMHRMSNVQIKGRFSSGNSC